jgi:hypothetical protein
LANRLPRERSHRAPAAAALAARRRLDDLIFNTAGGGLGIGLALWALRRRALREMPGP